MRTFNLWKTLVLSAAMLTMGGGMISCSDSNDDDKKFEGIPTITLYADKDAVDLTGGSINVVVTSDAPWTATVSESDVTLNKMKGNGNTNVTVTVPAHAERTIDVTFTATGYVNGIAIPKSAVLTIAQNEGGVSLYGTIMTVLEAGKTADGATATVKEAWVVAVSAQGYILTDISKANILVYTGSNGTVPAINTVLKDITGSISMYGGLLQFNAGTTYTEDGTKEDYTYPTPVEYNTYTALTSYLDETYNGRNDTHSGPTYATFKGTLIKDSGYYNVIVADRPAGESKVFGFAYPTTELTATLASLENKSVIVTGYLVGYTNQQKTANTYAISVVEDPDAPAVPIINTTESSLTFEAEGGVRMSRVNYTVSNLGENSVFAKLEGDTNMFVIGQPSGGVCAVTAMTNSEEVVKTATLTLYVAADQDAQPLASTTVALKIAAKLPEGVTAYSLVTSAPADWSGSYIIGYPTTDKCYILDAKYSGADTTRSTFTYTLLEAPAFDGTNIAYNANYNTVTIAKLAGTDYYTIAYADMYVGWISDTKNSCEFTATAPTAADTDYLWTISIDDNNVVALTLVATKDDAKPRKFQFNANNGQERFAIYTNTQKDVCLYTLK